MRRVRRIIFRTLVIVSALLCATTCALWVRSYRVADAIDFLPGRHEEPGERLLEVESDWGRVIFYSGHIVLHWWAYDSVSVWHHSPDPNLAWQRYGFGFTREYQNDCDEDQMNVSVPHWSAIMAFAALPLAWIKMATRVRAVQSGRCSGCGYDLRATPERCPECGKAGGANVKA